MTYFNINIITLVISNSKNDTYILNINWSNKVINDILYWHIINLK